MSFIQRRVKVDFNINQDQFSNGTNTLSLEGLRCLASINNANGYSLGQLSLRIYGMKAEDMNKLTNLGQLYLAARKYQVTVSAGDDVNGLTIIFTGTVYTAKIVYDQPNVCLEVESVAGFYEKMNPAQPFTQKGSVKVSDAIRSMLPPGFTLVDNQGVSAVISNPYYAGTAISQIQRICADSGTNCSIRNNTVYIWPTGSSVDNNPVSVSPSNGLVGYPTYQSNGITIETVFNPNLVNGKTVNLTSDAFGTTGAWHAVVVNHQVSSEYPGGPWFTQAMLIPPSVVLPVGF